MKFAVVPHLVVLCTDLKHHKKYILSTNNNKIKLPSIAIDNTNLITINQTIKAYLIELNLEDNPNLTPQLITLNSEYIIADMDQINPVFGFLVDYNINIKDCYWVEFDYAIPNPYSNLIFEVVQKLQ